MAAEGLREYRKGNWTVQETMILITAKKKDEERRMKSERTTSRPAELRWKWVEDFCWSHGCLRSQNQCNDKWDNLMREYKKVREFENGASSTSSSYWKLERHDRKDRNLPTNMLLEIYEGLVQVVEKRSSSSSRGLMMDYVTVGNNAVIHHPSLPPLLQLHSSDPTPTPTPPLSALQLPPPPHQLDTSQAKRRKKGHESHHQEEDTSTTSSHEEVGSAISTSASMIAEAIQSCEEQEERRHKEFLLLQERKLKIEEMKNETDREAMNGLAYAINGLANSIFGLASDETSRASK